MQKPQPAENATSSTAAKDSAIEAVFDLGQALATTESFDSWGPQAYRVFGPSEFGDFQNLWNVGDRRFAEAKLVLERSVLPEIGFC